MTTFREFWARSAHFGQNGSWDESRGDRVFWFGKHATFQQLSYGRFSLNLVTKRSLVSRRGIRKDIFKNFHPRCHLPPKSEIGQTGTSLRESYRSRDALQRDTVYSTLQVVVQGPGSFRGLVNFRVRCTVAKLRGVKVAQFSNFGLFSPYKTPKMYLPVTSLQPRGYIAE